MSNIDERQTFDRDVSIGSFVATNEQYYNGIFERLERAELLVGTCRYGLF